MQKKIADFVNLQKENILSDLAALVAIPSVKGEPEEGAPFGREPKRALLKMRELCDKCGFDTKIVGDAVLCADYAPSGADIALGILAHLDVVPVEAVNWHSDPFTLTERDGVLYGRGAIDDKGPAVAALYALKCVKELGVPLSKGVRLIFGTDEENGSADLEIYRQSESFPPLVFTPDGSFPVINIEKGMLRARFEGEMSGDSAVLSFHGGKIPNAVPDSAEAVLKASRVDVKPQSAVRAAGSKCPGAKFEADRDGGELRVSCKGRSAHASTPESGANAITALIALVNSLKEEPTLAALSRLFPFGETDGTAVGLKCADESGALTCVLSMLDIEDGRISGTIDIRFPVGKTLAFVRDRLSKTLGGAGLAISDQMGSEPHIVPENSEFVRTLLSVYERVEGEKGRCIAIGGGTYVHEIEGGVAFGAERGDTDYHMHAADEFITAEELLKDAVLFANVIIECCS